MRIKLFLIAGIFGRIFAADCDGSFVLDATHTTVQFNNQSRACYNWQLSYFSSGFSAVSVQFESAPNGNSSNVPGTWVAFAGTLVGGLNPNTAITQATSTFSGSFPWVRVRLVSSTGTGTIQGRMLGAQLTSANAFPSVFSPPPPNGLFYIPQDSDFSWVDQATATRTVVADGIYLTIPLNSASNDLSKYCATLPVVPWTITAAFMAAPTPLAVLGGIALQQTGNAVVTEWLQLNLQVNPQPRWIQVMQCTGVQVGTCANIAADTFAAGSAGGVMWERISDTGAGRSYETSTDGATWSPLHNYSTTRGLPGYGNITPNQACILIENPSNEPLYQYKTVSWKVCSAASTSQC